MNLFSKIPLWMTISRNSTFTSVNDLFDNNFSNLRSGFFFPQEEGRRRVIREGGGPDRRLKLLLTKQHYGSITSFVYHYACKHKIFVMADWKIALFNRQHLHFRAIFFTFIHITRQN